jgi:tetratricopeptide (TPR) repeat protein
LSASYDASKELLRSELASRIRECLVLRDWTRMEHWASHWVQVDPRNANAFKWLARASVGLKRLQKASYAYGRVLDFEPANEEALKFFKEYPSVLHKDPVTARSLSSAAASAARPGPTKKILSRDELKTQTLSPEERRSLARKCLEMGDLYSQHELFARAAQFYKESFEWIRSPSAALGAARSFHGSQQSHHAVHFLKQSLQAQQNWVEGRLLLGKILFETGQVGEAQREWQSVLKIEPDNREALNFLRHLLDKR